MGNWKRKKKKWQDAHHDKKMKKKTWQNSHNGKLKKKKKKKWQDAHHDKLDNRRDIFIKES